MAVQKAMEAARRNMVKVRAEERHAPPQRRGEHGAAKVLMAPAKAGDGIIAGGPMRAVFEVMGVTDIVAKSHGSTNPYNLVRATLERAEALDHAGRDRCQARQVGRRNLRLSTRRRTVDG